MLPKGERRAAGQITPIHQRDDPDDRPAVPNTPIQGEAGPGEISVGIPRHDHRSRPPVSGKAEGIEPGCFPDAQPELCNRPANPSASAGKCTRAQRPRQQFDRKPFIRNSLQIRRCGRHLADITAPCTQSPARQPVKNVILGPPNKCKESHKHIKGSQLHAIRLRFRLFSPIDGLTGLGYKSAS